MEDSTQHLRAEREDVGSIVPQSSGAPSFQTELQMSNTAAVDLLSLSNSNIFSTMF